MAQQIIKIGSLPSDGIYDSDRTLANKVNANFAELYAGGGAAANAANVQYQPSGDGAIQRTAQDKLNDVRGVRDFGCKVDGITNDTAPFILALTWLALNGGGTLTLPPGTMLLSSVAASLQVPSNSRIVGAGLHSSIIRWNDDGTVTKLFESAGTSSARASNIELSKFKVVGTWDTRGNASAYPFIMDFTDGMIFNEIGTEYSRVMGIVARQCTDVVAHRCEVRYSGRDGINFAQCAGISITDCVVEHCDDDAIAAHGAVSEPWGVRKQIVITGNRVFDAQGIKVLAARQCVISGNTVDCAKAQGINVSTVGLGGGNEGCSAASVVVITNNTITNPINRTNIDNLNSGCPGIVVTGSSARAGTAGAVPGEPNGSGGISDPYLAFAANSASSTVSTPGSDCVLIAGNVIARTLPACNGTATGPNGVTYSKFSDYGFGKLFTRTGWWDGQLAESDFRDNAISISGGVLRDVLVTGNIIKGLNSGLSVGAGIRAENVVFRGNEVIDCPNYGVLANTTGKLRLYVEDNLFDLDPFHKHPSRGANGTWATQSGPVGIFCGSTTGVVGQRNLFRNLYQDSDQDTSVSTSNLFADNILEADPVGVGGYSASNKGVGFARRAGGTRLRQVDADPASATYGQILTFNAQHAAAMPTSGKYLLGAWVWNNNPTSTGPIGWMRLTNGTSHVVGTDWLVIYGAGASAVSVLGNGAVVAQSPDSTTAGGNARGNNAVDFQTTRTNAIQVASGANAVVTGGISNLASGSGSVVVGGQSNGATGAFAVVAGGTQNQADGSRAWCPGGWQSAARQHYARGHWSGGQFAAQGDAQAGEFVLRRQTTDATATRLTSDAAAAGGANTLNLPNFANYVGRLVVSAKAAGSTDAAAWLLDIGAVRGNGAGTVVVFLGAGTSIAPSGSNGAGSVWRLSVAADTTNGGVAVSVTGAASTTINWHARVLTSEVVTAN